MLQKASNGRRIGAYVLDVLFIWIIILIVLFVSADLLLFAIWLTFLLYFGISEGSGLYGSPGKYLCGLMVVDEQGRPLTYGKSFLRTLCKILSSLFFGIGYLMGLFDENGKTLHDRIAGTMVVERAPVQSAPVRGDPVQGLAVQYGQPRLAAVSGAFTGKNFPVPEQGIVIGRSKAECSLVFPEGEAGQGISRVHCKIQFDVPKRVFVLYDMGSSYGTFLGNDARVWPEQPVFLRPGEEFYLAAKEIRFRVEISSAG